MSNENNKMGYEVLKGAVENTNEAFVTIDQDSRVVFFNKAAEKMFGYSRAEVLGRELGMILSPMCEAGHSRAVARYLETRQPKMIGHESEFFITRKSGETFPASISFSMTEVDGVLFFTGIIRDLTERKALEKQVIRSERLAVLGQAVAEISHEIKNPLLLVGGFARQLQKKSKDDNDRAKLQIIANEVERLEKLLLEFKDLSRPRKLRFEEVNVNELLREVLSLVQNEAEESGIEIQLDAAAEVHAEADREKLKQVLLNLLKNSLEALPEGGVISVGTKGFQDKVEILIVDGGEGIPEKILQRVFAPFFTTKEHGTGLGLSISRRIIAQHPGSSFSLTSKEGEGTSVTIRLAAAKRAGPSA